LLNRPFLHAQVRCIQVTSTVPLAACAAVAPRRQRAAVRRRVLLVRALVVRAFVVRALTARFLVDVFAVRLRPRRALARSALACFSRAFFTAIVAPATAANVIMRRMSLPIVGSRSRMKGSVGVQRSRAIEVVGKPAH
jgi:hypothetical protein